MPKHIEPGHDHIPAGFPYIVDYYPVQATAGQPAQTVIKLSDGTRIAVNADGERVKVGRKDSSLAEADIARFNFAEAFVNLTFRWRSGTTGDVDRRTAHRGHDHPTTKVDRARCRRDAG